MLFWNEQYIKYDNDEDIDNVNGYVTRYIPSSIHLTYFGYHVQGGFA